MTESEKRQSVVQVMRGWIGRKESDGSHKAIIDIYNNHKPLAQNYKVKYTDSWCMTTASAAYIKAGLADIFPLECSCNRAIAKAKSMGCWIEADSHVPKPADAILYDWQDKGKGDDMGVPDHVGIVEKVEGNTITVIEGNKSDAVQRRTVTANQKFIRGYICPKFSADSAPAPQPVKQESKPAASVPSNVLRKGDKGAAVGTLQTMLNAYAKAINKRISLNSKSDKNRIAYEKAKIKANNGASAKYKKYQAKADKMHYKSSKALDKMYKHANPLIRTSISDDLYQRSRRKADKYQAKFMKSQRKADKYKSTYENRAAKAGAAESKYLRSKHKAEKWQEAIDKSFRNVDVNSLPIQYTSAGKAYIEKLK